MPGFYLSMEFMLRWCMGHRDPKCEGLTKEEIFDDLHLRHCQFKSELCSIKLEARFSLYGKTKAKFTYRYSVWRSEKKLNASSWS